MSNADFESRDPFGMQTKKVYIEGKLNVIKNALIACKRHETRLTDYFPALE